MFFRLDRHYSVFFKFAGLMLYFKAFEACFCRPDAFCLTQFTVAEL